mgnify:CR=1 FL=1
MLLSSWMSLSLVGGSWFASGRLRDAGFRALLDAEELLIPETFEGLHPVVDRPEAIGVETLEALAARAAYAD